jgi:hypothetical protein
MEAVKGAFGTIGSDKCCKMYRRQARLQPYSQRERLSAPGLSHAAD